MGFHGNKGLRVTAASTSLFCSLLLGGASALQAQGLITNGSFENTGSTFVNNGQGYMNIPVNSTVIPGWKATNDQIAWLVNIGQAYATTPYGTMFLDLTGEHDNGSFGGVTQTITTVPSQPYRVSFSLGVNQNDSNQSGSKSVSVSAGPANGSFTFVPTGTGMQWGTFNFDFTATSTSTPVTLQGTSSGTGFIALFMDNVSVTAVPEPGSFAIVLGGVVSFGLTRLRKCKA